MTTGHILLKSKIVILSFILVILLFGEKVYADRDFCSRESAYAAETEAARLTSWDQLYRSFLKYNHCDDGAISEGYSYTVAKLLTDRWADIGDLARLSQRSQRFEEFVLSHVNESMSQSDADRVYKTASDNCPQNAGRLCLKLVNVVRNP